MKELPTIVWEFGPELQVEIWAPSREIGAAPKIDDVSGEYCAVDSVQEPIPVDYLEHLRSEGTLLIEAVRGADLDMPVPGLQWDVRQVAVHTGAVHRWATDIVRRRLASNETGGSQAFWPRDLADESLLDWLFSGLETLVDALASAPSDLDCFTFVPGIAPRTFWRRRQAHETAIHRIDVQAAVLGDVGSVTACSAEFAQDGLAELVGGFAVEPGFAVDRPGRLLLEANDGPAWLVQFGGACNLTSTGAASDLGRTDAAVRGSSSDLYRWAWNRPILVEIEGDLSVVDLWSGVRVL